MLDVTCAACIQISLESIAQLVNTPPATGDPEPAPVATQAVGAAVQSAFSDTVVVQQPDAHTGAAVFSAAGQLGPCGRVPEAEVHSVVRAMVAIVADTLVARAGVSAKATPVADGVAACIATTTEGTLHAQSAGDVPPVSEPTVMAKFTVTTTGTDSMEPEPEGGPTIEPAPLMSGALQQAAPDTGSAPVSGDKAPPPPTLAELAADPADLSAIVEQSSVILSQCAQVPALKEAILQRDKLQKDLDALKTVGKNFGEIARVGQALKAAVAVVLQQHLSEVDYLTLKGRHAALVKQVTAACKELSDVCEYAGLEILSVKLSELEAVDVSILSLPAMHPPVTPPVVPEVASPPAEGQALRAVMPVPETSLPAENAAATPMQGQYAAASVSSVSAPATSLAASLQPETATDPLRDPIEATKASADTGEALSIASSAAASAVTAKHAEPGVPVTAQPHDADQEQLTADGGDDQQPEHPATPDTSWNYSGSSFDANDHPYNPAGQLSAVQGPHPVQSAAAGESAAITAHNIARGGRLDADVSSPAPLDEPAYYDQDFGGPCGDGSFGLQEPDSSTAAEQHGTDMSAVDEVSLSAQSAVEAPEAAQFSPDSYDALLGHEESGLFAADLAAALPETDKLPASGEEASHHPDLHAGEGLKSGVESGAADTAITVGAVVGAPVEVSGPLTRCCGI
jgi:hypothetical protein